MAQSCLKFLKYTMCVANFLCFISGLAVLSFGIYMTITFKIAALTPNLTHFSISNMLLISGIVITCVSFLGFLGALKENRCLLLMFFLLLLLLMLVELTAACLLLVYDRKIASLAQEDLINGLKKAENSTEVQHDWDMVQEKLDCCGVHNASDWGNKVPKSCCKDKCQTAQPSYRDTGCLVKIRNWFEDNFLAAGVTVIVLCVIEVLGMCFAMTLFCHISRSGLRYKL
ncbi:leukocyte surface antigen CD53-like [Gouania willdenowi]|uniref:Tetraspanin n=1 Tax=Gouania willdenowi TaxID=441366 RepID=A0A8C5HN19_GOUWI|nr:leukocyte surface antigen CD53-like [Gouania willdenowi]